MAKIPSSKLSDKTSKKTGVVMVISVGGKAPKKPTKTADTEKAGQCGVVKKEWKEGLCRECGERKRIMLGKCAECHLGPIDYSEQPEESLFNEGPTVREWLDQQRGVNP